MQDSDETGFSFYYKSSICQVQNKCVDSLKTTKIRVNTISINSEQIAKNHYQAESFHFQNEHDNTLHPTKFVSDEFWFSQAHLSFKLILSVMQIRRKFNFSIFLDTKKDKFVKRLSHVFI